jgi:maltooligosyltrehalose trehalohydrolase
MRGSTVTTAEQASAAPPYPRPHGGGTEFRVFAPERTGIELCLELEGANGPRMLPMQRQPSGFFTLTVPGVGPGARYRYRVDGDGPFPDPASRFQPEGVHGASQVVDLSGFAWTDAGWRGRPIEELVIYELHVGTFTSAGTFAAAAERLPHLARLGVTAVELMPVADFPGRRNWGYDGVSPYAPARCYGTPDDLCRLVDTGHRLGLAVLLDVVYNHLGPDGNYLGVYSRRYFSSRHHTPWGEAFAFDGPAETARVVRDHFGGSAEMWIRDYHFDGLRLDATHAIVDDSTDHILAEVSRRARAAAPGRQVVVIAEDDRNQRELVAPGGLGFDSVWADDLHHSLRARLGGDRDGYYADFTGSTQELCRLLQRGWLFEGAYSQFWGHSRGTSPEGLAATAFVVCLDNHDQVGNRAFGERLHHQAAPGAYRAALALLLLSPFTPLLFMGQELAAPSPFLYFTDHEAELGRAVTCGRRREFARFSAFADETVRETIPDPQADSTFERSRLDWSAVRSAEGQAALALHRELLALRAARLPLAAREQRVVTPLSDAALVVRYPALAVVVSLAGHGPLAVPAEMAGWSPLLDTEEARFGGQGAAEWRPGPEARLFRGGAGALILAPSPRSAAGGPGSPAAPGA